MYTLQYIFIYNIASQQICDSPLRMNFNKLSVTDVDFVGKSAFIRVDYNVPQDETLEITNTARIDASIPTLKYILEKQPKYIVLCSHLGRPKGVGFEAKYSLKPVAAALEKIIQKPVTLLGDVVGDEVTKIVQAGTNGQVFLLENARFYSEETAEDEKSPAVVAFRK